MLYSSTLTQKGQATIPAPVRKMLGLKPGQKISFRENGKEFILEPTLDFFSLKGSLKSKIKYSDRKADKAVMKFVAQEYMKKYGKAP